MSAGWVNNNFGDGGVSGPSDPFKDYWRRHSLKVSIERNEDRRNTGVICGSLSAFTFTISEYIKESFFRRLMRSGSIFTFGISTYIIVDAIDLLTGYRQSLQIFDAQHPNIKKPSFDGPRFDGPTTDE